MKPRYANLVGKVFGRLTVLRYIGVKHDSANWQCGCYCGNLCESTVGSLNRKSKPTRSCGKCYLDHKYPSEWLSWRNMNIRCYSPDSKDYKNYGGRGIVVCDRWRSDFLFFLEDMGIKEFAELTLDRRDVNGNYEPANCWWLHRTLQNMNKRNTFTFLGDT